MADASEAGFPSLFRHESRADWGVSVLSGERDGKRRYLFEGGEERVMAAAHHHLMRRVEHPDRNQQATGARLIALLAKREGGGAASGSQATKVLHAQLEKLLRDCPGGFSGEGWQKDTNNLRVQRARQGAARQAQQALSAKSLERLAKAEGLADVWQQVVALVNDSGLASEELRKASSNDQQRLLGEAVRDLLHGADQFERRFDRFVMRYESAFQSPPSWQTATALAALVSPVDHVLVDPVAFRKQLKAVSRLSTLGARPNGTTYMRCLSMARALASALAAQGQMPADLLEVHAFIRATV